MQPAGTSRSKSDCCPISDCPVPVRATHSCHCTCPLRGWHRHHVSPWDVSTAAGKPSPRVHSLSCLPTGVTFPPLIPQLESFCSPKAPQRGGRVTGTGCWSCAACPAPAHRHMVGKPQDKQGPVEAQGSKWATWT